MSVPQVMSGVPTRASGDTLESPDRDGRPAEESPARASMRYFSLSLIAILATILTLRLARPLCIPIVVGLLVAYGLDPLVSALAGWKIPRSLTAAVLLLGLFAGVLWGFYSLSDDAASVLERLPEAAQKLRQTLAERQADPGPIEKMQEVASEIEKAASEAAGPPDEVTEATPVRIEESPFRIRSFLWSGSMGAAAVVGQIVMVLFLIYFILASGDLYKRKLVKIAGPSMAEKRITVQILDEINRKIERFLLIQGFTSCVVALVSWLAFRWFGIEQAGVWAVAAGLFNSIPYFGPMFVAGGMTVVSFVQFGTLGQALTVGGLSLLITTLEGYLLTPYLSSRAGRMNAVAVFVGLLFWGWLWGVWGMLLAVPMMMAVKVVCDHIEGLKEVGELLGE